MTSSRLIVAVSLFAGVLGGWLGKSLPMAAGAAFAQAAPTPPGAPFTKTEFVLADRNGNWLARLGPDANGGGELAIYKTPQKPNPTNPIVAFRASTDGLAVVDGRVVIDGNDGAGAGHLHLHPNQINFEGEQPHFRMYSSRNKYEIELVTSVYSNRPYFTEAMLPVIAFFKNGDPLPDGSLSPKGVPCKLALLPKGNAGPSGPTVLGCEQ